MKKTFFHDIHVSLCAKMAPFGGYMMPIQYEGIIKEHNETRNGASLFDTCHMGEFRIEGETALKDLESILSCDVAPLKTGQCKYGFICNPDGGTIDDQVIYRISQNSFLMVVNAATQDNDFSWIKSHCSAGTNLENISEETAKIDIQGPLSVKIVQRLMEKTVAGLTYYSFMKNRFNGKEIIISRTGYTGEIGFEIYSDEKTAIKFWNDCMELGAKPAGLGARDTLRLEMGFPLYGHELDEKRNAAQSGFTRAISSSKYFTGCESVRNTANMKHVLCGITMDDRRAARNGDAVSDKNGIETGIVTSGSFAPSIGLAVALCYIDRENSLTGTEVLVRNGRNEMKGRITDIPFYKNSTARKKIADFI
jgi:aminomethyltransferase